MAQNAQVATISKGLSRLSEALSRDNVSEEVLLEALDSKRKLRTRERAAGHPSATYNVLLKALDDPDYMVSSAALTNSNASAELLDHALKSMLGNSPRDYSNDVSSHGFSWRDDAIYDSDKVRIILMHKNASARMIADALMHPLVSVRTAAATNHNLSNPLFALSVRAAMCG